MSIAGFPTSSDIYLEVDGVKVAVVQSYSAKASKTSSAVEAFGESEPVATVPGQTSHVLELENRKEREIISGYDNVAVSADPDNPTVCQVEFSFSAAQGLNQIWLTAHITV